MPTFKNRRCAALLAASALVLLAAGCSSTSGGGGGGYFAKDGGGDSDVGLPSGSTADTASAGKDVSADTPGADVQSGGTDVMTVEIVDKPDVADVQTGEPDVKADVKADVTKTDTTVTGKCIAAGTCDPVKNGCTGSGEACDIGSDGAAGCFPPPNDVAAGGACDNTNGPFCQGGYHCGANATCQKFCCSASDCGSGKACTPLGIVPTDAIGICDP